VTHADVDECAVNNGGCSPHAYCTNTPGKHNCTCIGGYIGDGFNCSGKSIREILLQSAVVCCRFLEDR